MIIAVRGDFEYAGVASGKSFYFWQVATGVLISGDSWLFFGGGATNGTEAQVFCGESSVIGAENRCFGGEDGCHEMASGWQVDKKVATKSPPQTSPRYRKEGLFLLNVLCVFHD